MWASVLCWPWPFFNSPILGCHCHFQVTSGKGWHSLFLYGVKLAALLLCTQMSQKTGIGDENIWVLFSGGKGCLWVWFQEKPFCSTCCSEICGWEVLSLGNSALPGFTRTSLVSYSFRAVLAEEVEASMQICWEGMLDSCLFLENLSQDNLPLLICYLPVW